MSARERYTAADVIALAALRAKWSADPGTLTLPERGILEDAGVIPKRRPLTVFRVVLAITAPDEDDGGPSDKDVEREVAAALSTLKDRRADVQDVQVWG